MAKKYDIRKFEPVNNRVYEFLEAAVEGKYLFQEFAQDTGRSLRDKKNLASIFSYMDCLSPSTLLPKTKFRQIKGISRKDVYEFKKGDIRVYVIMKKPSVFVVLGAYKGTQPKDIKRIDKLFADF